MRKQTVLSVSKKGALSNITDNHSVKTYKRACRKFVNWLETAKNEAEHVIWQQLPEQ